MSSWFYHFGKRNFFFMIWVRRCGKRSRRPQVNETDASEPTTFFSFKHIDQFAHLVESDMYFQGLDDVDLVGRNEYVVPECNVVCERYLHRITTF
jgi:hypothetical protein